MLLLQQALYKKSSAIVDLDKRGKYYLHTRTSQSWERRVGKEWIVTLRWQSFNLNSKLKIYDPSLDWQRL